MFFLAGNIRFVFVEKNGTIGLELFKRNAAIDFGMLMMKGQFID
jgi:hypothetical protein